MTYHSNHYSKTMTKLYNTADICEEAHGKMLQDPEIIGGARHSYYDRHEETMKYTKLGQRVFDYYFNEVEERYEADNNYKRETN